MERTQRSRTQRSACRRCHARKVRCDASLGRPCSSCRSSGTACVAYEKRIRNRGQPKPDSFQPLLPTPTPAPADNHGQLPWSDEITVIDSKVTPGVGDTPCITSDRESSHAAEALSSVQDGGKVGDVKKHLVEMLSQDDIDERVMQKGVRIVYVGQEYSNLNYLIRHRARNEAVHHFPADHISRQYTSHELDRIPREAFTMPSQAVVDELLEQYFRYVNPGFPVLDEQVFMSQYRSRDPLNPPSLLVLQAVLLVGAHVSRNRPDRDELKTAFFRRAKMLFDARFEWNRDVVVQAALLLTWHSEGVEDIGANCYYWVGVAARTAQGLGMHRDTGPSTLISHDKRLWRIIWWTLVQFDSIVSLSYGRPQAINLDDSDVPELQASDFDLTNENIHMDFVLHQTRLACIISKVIRENFGLKISPTKKRAALMEADQKLAQWMASLPTSLTGHTDEPGTTPWVTMLHITYNNFLVLLHRPPPKPASVASVIDQDNMKICSAAAGSMTGLFETAVSRNELRFMNVFAVDALFTALIQLSAEIRVANPVLSAYAKQRFDSALDGLRLLSEYWLNAETILRLFEDSSERTQQELRIGKSVPVAYQSLAEESDSEADINSQNALQIDGWAYLISSPTTALQQVGVLNDQLDWRNMYWENSGFTDMGLYQNSPS